jgi:hypothetical protein
MLPVELVELPRTWVARPGREEDAASVKGTLAHYDSQSQAMPNLVLVFLLVELDLTDWSKDRRQVLDSDGVGKTPDVDHVVARHAGNVAVRRGIIENSPIFRDLVDRQT